MAQGCRRSPATRAPTTEPPRSRRKTVLERPVFSVISVLPPHRFLSWREDSRDEDRARPTRLDRCLSGVRVPPNEEAARTSLTARSPSPGGRGRTRCAIWQCSFFVEWTARPLLRPFLSRVLTGVLRLAAPCSQCPCG